MVRVLDVRVKRIGHGEEIRDYIAPASMFILTASGHAELWVDGDIWLSERFQLLHVGKGKRITVQSAAVLDVYMILYKASLPAFALREFHLMLKTDNPFMENWGLAPSEPLVLLEIIETMLEAWRQTGHGHRKQDQAAADRRNADHFNGLKLLQAKGEFIRFVHAALQERLENAYAPSLAEQVIRYIARNYRRMISMEQLAQQLNYTPQYVARKFKEQMGCSPLEYAIRLRIDLAQKLLRETTATLQEVADNIGYPDSIYFNRIFKKQTGLTPGEYRKKYKKQVSNSAMNRLNLSVVVPHPVLYHVNKNDNHYHSLLDGGNQMAMHKRKLLAVALLCLTMATSACGTSSGGKGVNHTGAGQTTTNALNASQTETTGPASVETRTFTMSLGDLEVPVQPKRVAALGYLGTVLALGVQPVASEEFLMNSPYLDGMLDGVTDVAESLEAMLDEEPDLIITQRVDQETVNKYSLIAPTVAMPYNSFSSIQEEMLYFGDLLNRKEEAEKWIIDFEKQTKELRDEVQAALGEGETVSVMQEYDSTVFIFGSKAGRGGRIMYEILGANPPEAIPAHMLTESFYEFSLEKLTEYTGDYLILTTEATLEELQADPIWGLLPAIKQGKVYLWTESQSWYRDPIAMQKQINDLAEWIIEASRKQ